MDDIDAIAEELDEPEFEPTDFQGKPPRRETCNLDNPEERFLWMFVALPGVNSAPMLMPISYYRKVSEHAVKCGAMLTCPNCGHEETPQHKYIPPAGMFSMFGAPGRWVGMDEPDPDENEIRTIVENIDPATLEKVREEIEILRKNGMMIVDPSGVEPDGEGGES